MLPDSWPLAMNRPSDDCTKLDLGTGDPDSLSERQYDWETHQINAHPKATFRLILSELLVDVGKIPDIDTSIVGRGCEILRIDGQGYGPDLTGLDLLRAIFDDVELGLKFPDPVFVFPDLGLAAEPCAHSFTTIFARDQVVHTQFVGVL